MQDDATMKRLDDMISWYNSKSGASQRCYKSLQVYCSFRSRRADPAAIRRTGIPVLWEPVPAWVIGAMGAAIAVIESVQQLNQFHGNWISYRSTCEALKHEKYLYLAKARPYATRWMPMPSWPSGSKSLVSQENAKWAPAQEIANLRASQTGGPESGPPVPGQRRYWSSAAPPNRMPKPFDISYPIMGRHQLQTPNRSLIRVMDR